jgi:hypothetical protein
MINRKTILIFLILLISLVCLFTVFTPLYETNDDGFMAMIVHGFGYFDKPSPYMLFSNVVLGWILSRLPVILGVLPYGYFTVLVTCVTFVSIYFLLTKDYKFYEHVTVFFILILLYIRCIAMPQFTLTAGMLAITAIVAFIKYSESNRLWCLVLSIICFLWAYLVRVDELIFLLLIFCPLIPILKFKKKDIISITILFVLITLCYGLNKFAYRGPIFEQFNLINRLRVPFNDYHAAYFFKDHPNYLSVVNLSANDIMLFGRGWFFADPQITNTDKLSYLLANYTYKDRITTNLGLGVESLKVIFSPELLPLLLVFVVGIILLKNKIIKRSLLIMLIMFIIITFIIGVLGRPSQLRIYYPCIFLMCIMVAMYKIKEEKNKIFIVGIICATVYTLYYQYNLNQQRLEIYNGVSDEIANNLAWVNSSILEAGISSWTFYPPLYNPRNKLDIFKLKLHDVGYYSTIPMSITYKLSINNKNPYFMQMFSGKSVFLINPNIDWLKIYCQEHYHQIAEVETVPNFKYLNMVRFRCGLSPISKL